MGEINFVAIFSCKTDVCRAELIISRFIAIVLVCRLSINRVERCIGYY